MKFTSKLGSATSRCSSNQERYVKASLASNNSYYLPITFLVEAGVDVDRLLDTIKKVVGAEPALNVVIRASGDHFICEPPAASPVAFHREMVKLAPGQLPQAITGFVYSRQSIIGAPVCKVHVAALDEPDGRTAVTIAPHHAVADAISLGLLVDRVTAFYAGAVDVAPVGADYLTLCKRHGLMPGEQRASDVDYWQDALRSVSEETGPLPLFASAASEGERASVQQGLDAADVQTLTAAASRAGVTLFQFFFAAFLVTLARQTGMDAACATFQSAGRHGKTDLEGVIGEFSNALPLFGAPDPDRGFDAFAATVRMNVRAALAYEALPYDEIIRLTGVHPRFGINWYPGTEKLTLDGRTYPARHVVEWQSDYDLNLHCVRREDGISLEMSHPAGAVQSARAALVLRQMASLLKQVAQDGTTPLRDLRLPGPHLAPAEVKQPVTETLWQRFAAVAARQPDGEAVSVSTGSVSYGALAAMIDGVAARLAGRGVSAGTKLAIVADRGAELIALLLAADRLDAVFAIYDPDYPATRIAVMNEVFRPDFQLHAAAPEEEGQIIGDIGLEPFASVTPGAPLAAGTRYVLFTSGTTGRPKCVATTTQGLLSFIDWHITTHGFGPAARFSLLGGLGHDPMLRDVFTALLCGGTVCVPPAEFRDDPRRLFDWLSQERITAAHLTPQMSKLISMGRRGGSLDDLRHAFLGGDKLHRAEADALFAAAPNVAASVFYGLTETPQAAAVWPIDPVGAWQEAPIGRGVNGRRVAVKRQQVDAAYGEVGEIVVEGADLFLGYYDAESGMSGEVPGPVRVLRTGDTGYFLPSGDIAIIGRKDDQVKIRGYRVGLGEIIAFLRQQPDVDQAAVIAEPMPGGENQLLAYITPAAGMEPDHARLVEACARQLPKHMVPYALFILETLPLTANGKLDKARLPREVEAAADGAVIDPATEIELAIVQVVRRTLGARTVSMTSTVRDLGADSLSYLNLMLGLEKIVGSLPDDWDEKRLRDLADGASAQGYFTSVESTILMRAISIAAVVAGHFGLIAFGGATSALYFIAGHSFGRFQIGTILRESGAWPILRTAFQIALPTLAAMLVLQFTFGKVTPVTWLFLGNFIGPQVAGGMSYWFIDVLIQMLLILALLFTFPPAREVARRHPFGMAFGFTLLSFTIAAATHFFWDTEPLLDRVPTSKIWLMGLGWSLALSQGTRQRIAVSSLVVGLLGIDWMLGREAQPLTLAAFATILLIDRIRLPRAIGKAVAMTAAASLFIYLVHFQVYSLANKLGGQPYRDWVAAAVAICIGIIGQRLWDGYIRRAPRLI